MNRTIAIAILFLFLPARQIRATPLEFHIAFDVITSPLPDDSGVELLGAHIDLTVSFDTAELTPSLDHTIGSPPFRRTHWPETNTTGKLIVTGSLSADGVYENPDLLFGGWRIDGAAEGGTLTFPILDFHKNGFLVRVGSMGIQFGPGYFPGPFATLHPKPFNAADVVSWDPPDLVSSTNRHTSSGITGFAVFVPEPSGFAMLLLTSAFVMQARRRASFV